MHAYSFTLCTYNVQQNSHALTLHLKTHPKRPVTINLLLLSWPPFGGLCSEFQTYTRMQAHINTNVYICYVFII